MRVLIDPGIMPAGKMIDLSRRASRDVSFITDGTGLREEYLRLDATIGITLYPRMRDRRSHDDAGTALRADPVRIWRKLIDDHQTLMIFDRTARMPLSSSLKIALIIDHVIQCQAYLEAETPDVLVYMATPHDIVRWIFARVAEELGVRVQYFQETLLPWRFALMEGLSSEATLVPSRLTAPSPSETLLATDYAKRKQGGFDDAFPKYESDRLKRNRGHYYNFSKDFLRSWKRPDLMLNKALCYRAYAALARAPSANDASATFFLHFQPERSTLPEAYGFAQQLAAVITLAEALPDDTRLYVKEHPAIFTADCHWKERLAFWYRLIAQVRKVQLVPIESDPYELIDRSFCVATIAGTIAGEALIRGKPVVIFGRGSISLAQAAGLHKYADQQALREFLAGLKTRQPQRFDLLEHSGDIAGKTYSGADGYSDFDAVQTHLEQVRFSALFAAFADIMGVTPGRVEAHRAIGALNDRSI
jgi:hypothetical protein